MCSVSGHDCSLATRGTSLLPLIDATFAPPLLRCHYSPLVRYSAHSPVAESPSFVFHQTSTFDPSMSLISPMRVVSATAVGLVVGTTLGALARGWMRLISNDPEFSWDGTLFIIGSFAVWGFAQGVVIGVRRITSRRWVVTLARAFGCLGMLPLFFGAGAIMAPTVILGGLAMHRKSWRSLARVLLAIVASIPVLVIAVQIQGDFGWSWRLWLGIVGLIVIYGSLAMASQGTFLRQPDEWRIPRLVKIVSAIGVMVAVALPAIGLGIG